MGQTVQGFLRDVFPCIVMISFNPKYLSNLFRVHHVPFHLVKMLPDIRPSIISRHWAGMQKGAAEEMLEQGADVLQAESTWLS